MRGRLAFALTVILACALLVPATARAATLAPSGAAPVIQRDPPLGPHARDDASHANQRLQLAPATTQPQPLRAATRGFAVGGAARASSPAILPSNPRLAREVFGFAPYWALSNTSDWNYSLMSTIAYFGLDVRADGSFDTSAGNAGFQGWTSASFVNVINQAHAANDRVVLVIKAFDEATINAIVSNPTASQNAINWTIQSIRSRALDGVNVDFEGSSSSSYPSIQSQFSGFVANLSNQVHAAIPGAVVSVDAYSGSASWDGGFMNIDQLAPAVDSIFVMAYDMAFGNTPGQAGPNAPLNGWTYNDTSAVAQYLSKAPASKIILGVPWYGYKWSTSSNQPYAATSGGGTADTFTGVVDDLSCGAQQLSRAWDPTASSPWAAWWSPAANDPCGGNHNSWRELYYDDQTSIMAKYDLINRNNLAGTGMWALGYEGTHPDLWYAIDARMRASWAASFDTSQVPTAWSVNLTRQFNVSLTNVGNSTWPATGTSPVHVAIHFVDAGGSWLTDQRFALPNDVAPGSSVTIPVGVTAPATTNVSTLQIGAVKEGQLWFKQWAAPAVSMQGATWMASYDAHAMPRSWTAGQSQTFSVVITNTGNQTWPAAGASPVRLGIHFADAPAQAYTSWLSDQRFSLPSDLAPGQSATITVTASAPGSSRPTVLEAELVREGQFWFYPTAPVAITTAGSSWAAGYDMRQVPRQWSPGQAQNVTFVLRNAGNQPWPASGSNPVHLGVHFAPASGLPASRWLTDQRVALPSDVAPGATVTVQTVVTAPASSGGLVLEAQLVKEQQFWFATAGAVSTESSAVTWLAGYDIAAGPSAWVAGEPQTVSITVTNTGNQTWAAGGTNPVRLSAHFASAPGLPYASWLNDTRVALPNDLAPGQSATLSFPITAPDVTGDVVFEAEMVKEWQFWFVQRSPIPGADVPASWIAGDDLSQAPRTWSAGQSQTFTVTLFNAGNQPWPASGPNPVHLGMHFAGNAGLDPSAWLSDQRISLAADLAPGQTATLTVTVTAPAGATGGVLEAQMVKEWQFWLGQRSQVSFLAG